MPDTHPAADLLRRAAFQLRNPFHRDQPIVIDAELADPLADWLDLEADVIDSRAADGDPEYATDTSHDHAEILARAILGKPKGDADDA